MCFRGSKYTSSAPGPTGGAYIAPPDPLAGKGGGAPGKERGRKRKGGGGGRGKLLPPNVGFYG